MSELDAERNPVEVLADEFAARYRAGEHPAVSEYCERHPEHAEEIKALFPSIILMERLKQKEDSDFESAQQRAWMSGRRLERVGDYEIIREIGRGGMGVVFQALQSSLGRTVALKILSQSATASPRQVKRFEREARAAARLHHTNIVPVFGVGHEDDLHFYVMQYIEGVGLDEVLRALKTLAHDQAHASDGTHSDLEEGFGDSAAKLAEALRAGSFEGPQRSELSSSGTHNARTTMLSSSTEVQDGLPSYATPTVAFEADEPSSHQNDLEFVAGNGNGTEKAVSESELPRELPEELPEELPAELPASELPANGMFGPQYFKSVARMGLQAADALQYAHTQGVLHRDIKPGNLLLDAMGTVWITDFGLAKLTEHQDLTKSGDIVGTLRYMAPEQFDGASEPRSDLYSLGLTLYEFLTLRPACDETAIKQLMDQRTRDSMTRPRAINPAVPRDLETIVLKATAVDLDARYPSASALAEDLERFIDDRPILARRATAAERLVRWSRRNPAIATLSAIAISLAATLLVVLSMAYYRVDLERRQVLAANDRAEENLRLAIRAFDGIIDNISSRGVPQSFELQLSEEDESVPQYETVVTAADAELLQKLLGFFDEFSQQNSADLQAETAKAYRRVGDIHLRLGDPAQAEAKYQQTLQLYELLSEERPDESEFVVARARLLRDLAEADRMSGEYISAYQHLREAIEWLSEQPPEIAAQADVRFELAEAYLATVPRITPRRPRGERPPRRNGAPPNGAPRVLPPPRGPGGVSDGGGPPPRGELMGGGSGSLGKSGRPPTGSVEAGGPEAGSRNATAASADGNRRRRRRGEGSADRERMQAAAREALSEAHDLLEGLLAENADHPQYRLAMARCYLGQFLVDWNRRDRTQVGCDRAVALLEDLVQDYPQDPLYRFELSDTLSIVSYVAANDQQSLAQLERARDMAAELVRQFPNVPQYSFLLGNCLIRLANTHGETGDFDTAVPLYEQAIFHQQQLVEQYPTVTRYQMLLARSVRDALRMMRRGYDAYGALEMLLQAISVLEEPMRRHSDEGFALREFGNLLHELAETQSALGDEDEATETWYELRSLYTRP